MKEWEYKWLLQAETFRRLDAWTKKAYGGERSQVLQINYYYDTSAFYFHRQAVTVRIRQRGDALAGMVKTHNRRNGSRESEEEAFVVETVPQSLIYQNHLLDLQGQLTTDRTRLSLPNGLMLCMDQSFYLGMADYEIELEYPEASSAQALSLARDIQYVLNVLGEDKTCISADERPFSIRSKSARFFTAKAKMPPKERIDLNKCSHLY